MAPSVPYDASDEVEVTLLNSDGADAFAGAMATLAAGDLQSARRLMKHAAELDHVPAVYLYGCFVEQGVGGKPSIAKALRWFERAARQGDLASCIRLGQWHASQGDVGRAKYFLRRSWPDPHAALLLAKLYSTSRSWRATVSAKQALAVVAARSQKLSDGERAELAQLQSEYKTRNPNAIWSRNNQRLPKPERNTSRRLH